MNEKLKEILDYNPVTGQLTWKADRRCKVKIGDVAGSINTHHKTGKKYILIGTLGKQYRAHRVAWFIYHGTEPEFEIDHINGDGTDNRIVNLRMTTTQGNSRNQRNRSTNTSGVMGVRWVKKANKWVAGISHKGKNVHLGLFTDFNEAVKVRKAAEKLYGYHPNHGSNRPLEKLKRRCYPGIA